MKKLNAAIIGYGRSGYSIHARFMKSKANDIFNVVAVVEYDPARQEAAKADFGCDTYSDYRELFNRNDIDLVVNASYSNEHYPVSKDLMEHGFNVLCEKPLAKTPEQVQDLIDTAKKNNVVFTIFHQYRYNEYYSKMVEVINSGILGKIRLIRAKQNSFSRRYDWQTLLYREGGSMRNNAAHTIEQVMDLAGSDELPKIYSKLEIWNAVGDAEDYMFAVMEYSNGKRFEVEFSAGDAYAAGRLFEVFGDHGTMHVYNKKITYKYYLDEECPKPVLDHKSLHHPNGDPAYPSNNIVWHEEVLEFGGDVMNEFSGISSKYYHDLYNHMVNGGELFIKPEHIKAQIAIFREIEKQNPLEQKYFKPE